jgi:hypothetical protein
MTLGEQNDFELELIVKDCSVLLFMHFRHFVVTG